MSVLHDLEKAEGELVYGYFPVFWALELKPMNYITQKAPWGPSRFYKY